ncbi:uncharacterized protein [Nicotiana tomentosiformis]|uniref:uncharacterized protein n=1 Tax=Nicotiana tomentosiformis TaxID=4098 RepID=UPI00388C7411
MAVHEAPSQTEGISEKDSGKVPESSEIEDASHRSQQTIQVHPTSPDISELSVYGDFEALALHQEEFSKSRMELRRREADFRGLLEERNALKLHNGQKEEEIKDLRVELAKAYQDQTDLTEQAKSEAEKAKAEADAFVAVYRADAEVAQVQEKKAAETAQTRAYWVAELAKSQSQRETLEEILARGFNLTEEKKRLKSLKPMEKRRPPEITRKLRVFSILSFCVGY